MVHTESTDRAENLSQLIILNYWCGVGWGGLGAQPFNCLILSLLRSQTLIPTYWLIMSLPCHTVVSPLTRQQVPFCSWGTSSCGGQSPLPSDQNLCRSHLPAKKQVRPRDCDADMFTNQWGLPGQQKASLCRGDRRKQAQGRGEGTSVLHWRLWARGAPAVRLKCA